LREIIRLGGSVEGERARVVAQALPGKQDAVEQRAMPAALFPTGAAPEMIRLRVKQVAEKQGVASAADLARRTGVAFATANRLWKNELGSEGDRGIGLLTLWRVAQALDVKVADLYEEDWLARRTALAGTAHSAAG
jgi:DNA-binding Xre family transcriptional regulator